LQPNVDCVDKATRRGPDVFYPAVILQRVSPDKVLKLAAVAALLSNLCWPSVLQRVASSEARLSVRKLDGARSHAGIAWDGTKARAHCARSQVGSRGLCDGCSEHFEWIETPVPCRISGKERAGLRGEGYHVIFSLEATAPYN
jgi:hypothetical protein